MIPENLLQVLKHEGVVAIATQGENGPHLVNTWNSYILVTEEDRLLLPAGYMHATETNVAKNPRVLVTVGSREVEGSHGPGTGFLIEGVAVFLTSGPEYDSVKRRHSWARAAVAVTVDSIIQTL